MKKLLIIFIIGLSAVSCLEGGEYSDSYSPFVTFEYSDNTFGADSLCLDRVNGIGLGWDLLAFYHKVDTDTKEFKGGFLVSKLYVPESGVTVGLENNAYRVNAKAPRYTPNKFAVFSLTSDMPENHMKFIYPSNGEIKATCTMHSVRVNNTVAIADAVGDNFEESDFLLLKANGYLAGVLTDSAEITLVDMRKDSLMSHWTEFKLDKLGTVDEVRFELESSKVLDIPLAVCMDNFVVNISLASE